jgi:hypothetical protein
MTPAVKKRKANHNGSESTIPSKKPATADKDDALDDSVDFVPLSLEDIRSRVKALCVKVPTIPADEFGLTAGGGDNNLDQSILRDWAMRLQTILEEFNLLVCCVATATYKWGTDRSGAADQNLSLLCGELASSQEHIASTVTPRLTNVLAPVVDLVVDKVITTKSEGSMLETKENHYTRKLVDPDFIDLCYKILARNAPLLRHVVLANFNKILRSLKDFLLAQKNDNNHDRGFAY